MRLSQIKCECTDDALLWDYRQKKCSFRESTKNDWKRGFENPDEAEGDQFAFRQGRSRETSYARDYDRLFELLKYEKEHGNILWVMGHAFSFDADARRAMQAMIENGYADGLMAGNALATHDLEGAMFHTALGQDIYTQKSQPNGHYNHLDVINRVRKSSSIRDDGR